MRVFAKLRDLAERRSRYLPELRTTEDRELAREIGYHQALGAPLTLKQVMRLGVGSSATAQRRLARLKRLGLVRGQRSPADQRVVELTLSPACMRAFLRLEEAFAAPPARHGHGEAAPRRHLCSLCDGAQAGSQMLARFLADGLRARERCVLIAGAEAVKPVLDALPSSLRRRAASGDLAIPGGLESADALGKYVEEAFAGTRLERRPLRLAWSVRSHRSAADVERIERQMDRLLGRYGGHVLCQYDVTRLSGGALIAALRSHREVAEVPYLLG